MKVGRNDPCPCGSGKKYQKCCLDKEESGASVPVEASTPPDEADEAVDLHDDAQDDEAEPWDERDQALEARWIEFEGALPDERLEIFERSLQDGVIDAEFVYEALEMFYIDFAKHDQRDQFERLLDLLQQRHPELYEAEISYYLEWRLGDAMAFGLPEKLPALAAPIADTIEERPALFWSLMEQLEFYGQLELMTDILRRAWPRMTPAERQEWKARAVRCEIFRALEGRPRPLVPADGVADEGLLERLSHYDEPDLLTVRAVFTGLLDGAAPPSEPASPEQDQALAGDPQAMDALGLQFVGWLHHHAGTALSRGNLVQRTVTAYLRERLLTPPVPARPARGKKTRKGSPARSSALCPDRTTLDPHLVDMLGPFSERFHAAAALVGTLPAWLAFLEDRGLITPEMRREAVLDVEPIVDDMRRILETSLRHGVTEAMDAWDDPLSIAVTPGGQPETVHT